MVLRFRRCNLVIIINAAAALVFTLTFVEKLTFEKVSLPFFYHFCRFFHTIWVLEPTECRLGNYLHNKGIVVRVYVLHGVVVTLAH